MAAFSKHSSKKMQCKQNTNAANKINALQAKKENHCRQQKTNAVTNKKDGLQTKTVRKKEELLQI